MVKMVVLNLKAIGSPILGVIIPGIVFTISIVVTYLLYRHFSKRR